MKFSSLLMLLLLIPLAFATNAGFDDRSLSVTITVNSNGTAHVREEIQLLVSGTAVDTYKSTVLSTQPTVQSWYELTKSENLRYHVLGADVNTQIVPKPLQQMVYTGNYLANIIVEYDTSAPIFNMSDAGPRKTNYELVPAALSFNNAAIGQVIPENTVLTINTPANLKIKPIKVLPDPTYQSVATGSTSTSGKFVWNATGGAIALTPTIGFSFQVEEPLDEEVGDYFSSLQQGLTSLVFSNYGLLALLITLILGGMVVYLRQIKAL